MNSQANNTQNNNPSLQSGDSVLPARDDAEQCLTFMLAGEEYGVDILRVQEIKGWGPVTRIPNTPSYVLGVINLRGTVVPVVDLRKRFGIESVPFGKTTVVIVVKVHAADHERTMGLVVDAVSEVYVVPPESSRVPPDFGGSVRTEFISGLATVDDKMVILLDIDRLIEVGVLASAAA